MTLKSFVKFQIISVRCTNSTTFSGNGNLSAVQTRERERERAIQNQDPFPELPYLCITSVGTEAQLITRWRSIGPGVS